MATGNYICDKVQRALVAHLAAQTFTRISSSAIYKGIQRVPALTSSALTERSNPRIECICQRAVPETPANVDGCWIATAIVRVIDNADDSTDDQHHTDTAEVMAVLVTDSIASDLSSAASDFAAHLVTITEQSWEVSGRSWAGQITLQIHCTGSDIS